MTDTVNAEQNTGTEGAADEMSDTELISELSQILGEDAATDDGDESDDLGPDQGSDADADVDDSDLSDLINEDTAVDQASGKPIDPETGKTYTGELHQLDASGDVRVKWDKDDPQSVVAAKSTFDHLTSQAGGGHRGFKVAKGKGATDGSLLSEFDPDARRIAFVRQAAGG